MSAKELTLILLDVGASMYKKYKENKTCLDVSLESMILLIQQQIFAQGQNELGILLIGADESEDNMIYIQELQQSNIQLIRDVQSLNQHDIPQTQGGDIFRSIDQGINLLNQYAKDRKVNKKIYVITNGAGATQYNNRQIDQMSISVIQSNTKINVIGVDFMNQSLEKDDHQNNNDNTDNNETFDDESEQQTIKKVKTDDSQNQQATQFVQELNENYLQNMIQNLGQNHIRFFNINEAMKLYGNINQITKLTRCKFKQNLEITDKLQIQVQFHTKSKINRLPTIKQYSQTDDLNADTGETISQKQFEDDENVQINKDDLIKAYQYGKQIVPVSQILQQEIKYESDKCFKILGFANQSQVPRESFLSTVDILLPPENTKDQIAFNSLVYAMDMKKVYGIVRYVFRQQATPKLAAIIPHISKDLICFYMVILPTIEDIRDFQFNSLKDSTEVIKEFIENMDLTQNHQNENGETTQKELLKPKDVFNPISQNYCQQLMYRAINNDQELQSLDQNVQENLNFDQKMHQQAQQQNLKIKQNFKLQENQIKNKKKKVFWQDILKNNQINAETEELIRKKLEDIDEDEIQRNIRIENPIKDFNKMINEKREDLVNSAITQLQRIIMQKINSSDENQNNYSESIQYLMQLRIAAIREDEVESFNDFMYQLRDLYRDSHQVFLQLMQNSIQLIQDTESISGVSQNERNNFYQ